MFHFNTMFCLSDTTSIEVKASQFTTEPYLQVKRHLEHDRWINVSRSAWKKMTSIMQTIDQAISDRREQGFDLYKTKHRSQQVLVSQFNEDLYVGIHLFDKNGQRERGKGLNFNMTEWQKLKDLTVEIDASLTPQVLDTAWEYPETMATIYKDTVKSFQGQTKHEGVWSFIKPEIQKPKHGSYFMIQEREIVLPKASELLVMCYAYLLGKCIKALIKCSGCAIDHPSQINHMDGCLMTSEEALEMYGDQARQEVAITYVVSLYNSVRERLDLPPVVVGGCAVEAYLKMTPIKTTDLDQIYVELFETTSN